MANWLPSKDGQNPATPGGQTKKPKAKRRMICWDKRAPLSSPKGELLISYAFKTIIRKIERL